MASNGAGLLFYFLGHGCSKYNFSQAIFITSIAIAASSIPSAPGAWGVFEAGVLIAMMALDISYKYSSGFSYAIVAHLAHFLPVVILGVIVAFREYFFVSQYKEVKDREAGE